MNIMQYLGFSKKGTEDEPVRPQPKQPQYSFSDKQERKDGETRIYNLIILDESGSMDAIKEQAYSGANETIHTIRAAQNENPDDNQMIALVTFDTGANRPAVRTIIDCDRIENVQDLTPDQYQPYGGTPLYDAMGFSITALKELVKEGDNVLVTVITDGFENSSRYYSAEMIKELVNSLSAKGWVFTYIGANQDSEQTAHGLGISSAMDFEASAAGTGMMYRKMSSSHRRYYNRVRMSKKTGELFDYDEDFFSEKESLSRVTPEWIEDLSEGKIFVFGSNEAGHHNGGAAKTAADRFGAIYGQGEGLQGRSYAIPTDGKTIASISRAVDRFVFFAESHPEMTFLVTRIGCGVAGYQDDEIAPLFANAYSLSNVHLPASFWRVLTYRYKNI